MLRKVSCVYRISVFKITSNLDAVIQILLHLHKPNSPIFHFYVTFRLTGANYPVLLICISWEKKLVSQVKK